MLFGRVFGHSGRDPLAGNGASAALHRISPQVGDKDTEAKVVLIENDIPFYEFPPEVIACLPQDDWAITEEEIKKRWDIRDRYVCSVDPPGLGLPCVTWAVCVGSHGFARLRTRARIGLLAPMKVLIVWRFEHGMVAIGCHQLVLLVRLLPANGGLRAWVLSPGAKQLPPFTLSTGCKDIDDALHVRELPNGNLEVGVHIADVTHFLKEGTAMDIEVHP